MGHRESDSDAAVYQRDMPPTNDPLPNLMVGICLVLAQAVNLSLAGIFFLVEESLLSSSGQCVFYSLTDLGSG